MDLSRYQGKVVTIVNVASKCGFTGQYGVTFDMFAKVDVNGENACELYRVLTSLDTQPKGAGRISWNFEKFLIDRTAGLGNYATALAAASAPHRSCTGGGRVWQLRMERKSACEKLRNQARMRQTEHPKSDPFSDRA